MVVLFVLVLSGVLFAGLRGNTGTDTFMYRTLCVDSWAGRDTSNYEPAFRWLAIALGPLFGQRTQGFIFTIALIQGVLLLKILRLLRERDLYYAIFTSSFYINLVFNQIRVGVALLLISYAFLLSIRKRHRIATAVTAMLALLTQITVAPLAILFIRRRPWLLIGFTLVAVLSIPFVAAKFNGAMSSPDSVIDGYHVGIGLVLTISLIATAILMEPMEFRSKALLMVLFGGYALFGLMAVKWLLASRVALIFEGGLYVLLLIEKRTLRLRAVMLIIAAYHVYGSLTLVRKSDDAMQELIANNPGFTGGYQKTAWVPYKLFWKDESVDNDD